MPKQGFPLGAAGGALSRPWGPTAGGHRQGGRTDEGPGSSVRALCAPPRAGRPEVGGAEASGNTPTGLSDGTRVRFPVTDTEKSKGRNRASETGGPSEYRQCTAPEFPRETGHLEVGSEHRAQVLRAEGGGNLRRRGSHLIPHVVWPLSPQQTTELSRHLDTVTVAPVTVERPPS